MTIKQNENLAKHTTFKIGGPAKFFCVVTNDKELREAVDFAAKEKVEMLMLGGGSNMLISDNGFNGLAVAVDFKGWEVKESGNEVVLKVASGENWDKIVELAVKKGWWGIENLSHIPGKTGAIAVQNVGAYGQEARQVVSKVTVFEIATGEIFDLDNVVCGFGYRESIFNRKRRGELVILQTYFKLSKAPKPNLWYRDLNLMFAGKQPSLAQIRKAVIGIRDQKFPFPKEAKNGNAGSFFKNAIVDRIEFGKIKIKIAHAFGFEEAKRLQLKSIAIDSHFKIPAAFLLDVCGVKGVKHKNVAINKNQPLVIVNATGKAKAVDVLELAGGVLALVKEKTGLDLEIEPELIGFSKEELAKYDIIKKH